MLTNFLGNIKLINRISYLLNALTIIILLWCGIRYLVMNKFMIEDVLVMGNVDHITQQQVDYIVQNKFNDSIFTVDINKMYYEFVQLPWVKEVSISRVFPNKLEVNVVEYKAVARFADSNLISDTGEIFNGADNNNTLPIFYLDSTQTQFALELYKMISPAIMSHNLQIVSLRFDGVVIQLVLSDGEKIILCTNELNSGLNRLNLYWDKLKSINSNLKLMNFCYKNAVAINVPLHLRSSVR